MTAPKDCVVFARRCLENARRGGSAREYEVKAAVEWLVMAVDGLVKRDAEREVATDPDSAALAKRPDQEPR